MERQNPSGSFEPIMFKTLEMMDDNGVLHLAKLPLDTQQALSDLTRKGRGIRDIFNPTQRRVEQAQHYQYKQGDQNHRAFLGSTNEFFPVFDPSDNPSNVAPWWHRFAVVAPDLHDWLNARESAFIEDSRAARMTFDSMYVSGQARSVKNIQAARNAFPVRTEDHVDALRLAYCIASQLVCEGDVYAGGVVSEHDTEILVSPGNQEAKPVEETLGNVAQTRRFGGGILRSVTGGLRRLAWWRKDSTSAPEV